MTLTEFLLARIAEDESNAEDALHYAVGIDNPEVEHLWQWVHSYKPLSRKHGWSTSFEDGSPSPARVLAECEAKRRIVDWFRVSEDPSLDSMPWQFMKKVLFCLAQSYADHPNFNPAWRA